MNPALQNRLEGIRERLVAGMRSSANMNSVCQGQERELFIRDFLSLVMPPGMRFGTGQIIDRNGNESGQLDVVIEFPFSASLGLAEYGPRLYFADSVGAVVEVKSDIAKQWEEVKKTVGRVRSLRREFVETGFWPRGKPEECVPVFAVGYRGWGDVETVRAKAEECELDGLLVIESGVFVTGRQVPYAFQQDGRPNHSMFWARDEIAILGLVFALHRALTSAVATTPYLLEYTTESGAGHRTE